jgi:hypothetical protein
MAAAQKNGTPVHHNLERGSRMGFQKESQAGAGSANQIGRELADYARTFGAELFCLASSEQYAHEFLEKPSPMWFVEGARLI